MSATLQKASIFAKSISDSDIENMYDNRNGSGVVDKCMIELCVGLSFLSYNTYIKADFDKVLKNSNIVKTKFPDLCVRFYQKGVTLPIPNSKISFNPPHFIGLITGSTLILVWRGTSTVRDIKADLNFDSIAKFNEEGLEVQRQFYELICDEYKDNFCFIKNYIEGEYRKTPDSNGKKDGTPIKNIVLTGQSLGGGIANMAHLCLMIPSSDFNEVVNAVKGHNVTVQTCAFSAPMGTIIENDTTKSLIKNKLYPNMVNITYSSDFIPRCYSNLQYINDVKEAVGTITGHETIDDFCREILAVAERVIFTDNATQARRYCHIGKQIIITYDGKNKTSIDMNSFDTATYASYNIGPSRTLKTAYDNHKFLSELYSLESADV